MNDKDERNHYPDEIELVEITFKIDPDRINWVCSVDDIGNAQEGMINSIKRVVAASIWDEENEQYFLIEDALPKVGKMAWGQMQEILNTSMEKLNEQAGTSKKPNA
jgi:hypothetical protein